MSHECEKFKLNELTPDIIKCLIFVQGLSANKDTEIRVKILSKLEIDSKLTLKKIDKEFKRLGNVKLETANIEVRYISYVRNVRPFEKKEYRPYLTATRTFNKDYTFLFNPQCLPWLWC